MRKWRSISAGMVLLVAMAVLLSGCASQTISGATRVFYLCEGGSGFDVEIIEGGEIAIVNYAGRTETLRRVKSASDLAYSDGELTFHSKGKESYLESGGKVIMKTCRVERSW